MRLLLVEDDARIARFVAKGLREQTYAVDVSATGEDALYQAAVNTYDLVILDVMIPAPDGFAVCRELRKSGQRMPILMLTARDAVEDRIAGLDHGGDGYFTNPLVFRERLAWRLAVVRRKIDAESAKPLLHTRRGVGYVLVTEAALPDADSNEESASSRSRMRTPSSIRKNHA